MPSNLISRTSCSIYPINHPTLPAGLPSQEYKHHAFKSSSTGAIQEIVTIESSEDTLFEVKLDIHPCAYSLLHDHQPNRSATLKEDDYLVYVQLDGINAQRSKRHRSQNGPTRISGVYSTDYKSSRPFQFGKLQLVDPDDDNRICQDDKIIQALGTIQVNVVKCTLGPPKAVQNTRIKSNPSSKRRPSPPPRHPRRSDPGSLQTTNQMIFSERSKKACQVNTVGLGKPVPSPREAFHNKKTIRPVLTEDPNPFLQFIFKYKPRSILEAEGIVAPPPPPQSPPRDPRLAARDKTRQSSVKNEISNNHDYLSGSDRHQGSHDQQEDEKKPKCKTEPVYISIDSDSETDSSESETKRTVIKVTSNGHSHGNGSNGTLKNRTVKSENGGHDENRPPRADHSNSNQQPTSDSKKRARSSMTINDQSNKRRSSITNNNSIHQNGGGLSQSSNNKINPQTDPIFDAKFRESNINNVDLDESSDDDEKFREQILGPKRAKGFKDDVKDSKNLHHSKKKSEWKEDEQSNKNRFKTTIVAVNNTSNATATTSNLHHRKIVKEEPEKKTNPSNFVDLTELDSD